MNVQPEMEFRPEIEFRQEMDIPAEIPIIVREVWEPLDQPPPIPLIDT